MCCACLQGLTIDTLLVEAAQLGALIMDRVSVRLCVAVVWVVTTNHRSLPVHPADAWPATPSPRPRLLQLISALLYHISLAGAQTAAELAAEETVITALPNYTLQVCVCGVLWFCVVQCSA